MKTLIKIPIPSLLIALILALAYMLALVPKAQAVSPAPDGAYPNFTTAEGQNALQSLTGGAANTALGWRSLFLNSTGNFNTGVGAGTLVLNTADSNTAVGAAALLLNTTGVSNSALGSGALGKNTTGSNNVAIGFDALFNQISNNNNVALGSSALYFSSNGGGNIAIGTEAGLLVQTAGDTICIGAAGADVSGTCFIGSIRDVTTQNNDAIPVLIDSAGQLGTASSSRRFKTDIKPIDRASESILALKPVSFRYKVHKDTTPQFGLIAEEVAEANPDLVIYDADRKPYTVRYDAVNAMLLNEFLKEHKKVEQQDQNIQKQDAIIARLEKQIKMLTAGLQKVSAELEVNKPAPKTVLNNQ